MRVPTWLPFHLQFYMNGNNLLARKLQKKNISYRMHDNAFLKNSHAEAAQKLSGRINPEDLHKVLDVLTERYCLAADSLNLSFRWTVRQTGCATDVMFKQQAELEPVYDEIIRTAIHTVKPDNIATFLGKRIIFRLKKKQAQITPGGCTESSAYTVTGISIFP